MSLIIQHNLAAMNSSRMLNITTGQQAKSTEKLASGYRINRAADDAAGLSISEKIRKMVRGLDRASMNSMDGVSMVQIADGAMGEIHDMLQRGNVLAIQAANGTNSVSDREAIAKEMNQLCDEIDRISDRTKFNEVYVLKGEQVGVTSGDFTPSNEITIKEGDLPSWATINPETRSSGGMTQTIGGFASSTINFSQLTPGNVSDLVGAGFYTTCCTCDNHYSIEFVEGNTNTRKSSGYNYIYQIGIEGVSTGEELIDRIMEATKDSGTPGQPNGHYTIFNHESGDPNTLWIHDNRPARNRLFRQRGAFSVRESPMIQTIPSYAEGYLLPMAADSPSRPDPKRT